MAARWGLANSRVASRLGIGLSFIVGYRFVMRRRYDPSTTQDYPSWVWLLRSSSARRKA
jgi:hypothetical protein